jgi:hypothetical protein
LEEEMRRETNIGLGVFFGFALATFYSAFVVVLYAIRGNSAFDANGITLLGTVSAYYFGGIVGGVIVGLLLPLATWRWGSVLVGVVAAFPVFLGIGIAMYGGPGGWGPNDRFGLVTAAILLGGFGGYAFWEPVRRDEPGVS